EDASGGYADHRLTLPDVRHGGRHCGAATRPKEAQGTVTSGEKCALRGDGLRSSLEQFGRRFFGMAALGIAAAAEERAAFAPADDHRLAAFLAVDTDRDRRGASARRSRSGEQF